MRVVSLCPSNTDIVCALGASEELVGLDRSSDAPDVVHLPRVGRDLSVDLDAVAALRPDLVLASLSVPGMERNVEGLAARGLPHVVIDACSLPGILACVRQVGALLGRDAAAGTVVAGMEARLAAVRASAERLPARPVVHLEWWPKPIFVPGRACWTRDMITLSGGVPAFGDREGRSLAVDADTVRERAPDLLLTSWCGVPHDRQDPARMARRPGWDALAAVRGGWMVAAEERCFGRPGPHVVEGVEWLHRLVAAWCAGGASC